MKLMSRLLLAGMIIAAPAAAAQQTTAPAEASKEGAAYTKPKTSWGVPDLQGFWTNTSFTSMQRTPLTSKLVLSEEEAASLTRRNTYTAAYAEEAGASKVDKESSDKLLADKNPSRGYNTFWMDPGKAYAKVKGEYRSSWITFPANGRIPYSEAGIAANTRSGNFDIWTVEVDPEQLRRELAELKR